MLYTMSDLLDGLQQGDYQEALKLGEVLVAYSRVMMIGAGGVGKSSFLRGLMNKRLPQAAESTILADTKTVKPFWAKAGESADSYWVEVTDQDEIQELAGLVQLVAQVKSGHSTPSRAAKILSTMAAAAAVGMFYPLGFIPHKVPTIGDEYVSNIKDGVVRNVLEQALQHAESSPGNPSISQSEVLMHVWDCGGQPVFLDILPAFLTSRTMFLLFFDARRPLLSKCETLSHKQGRVVSTKEESFTVLQLLTQWMACIHVTLSRQNVAAGSSNASAPHNSVKEYHPNSRPRHHLEKSYSPSHQQHKEHCSEKKTCGNIIPDFPRIIPVGTHGDDAAVKGRKSILDTLWSHCEDKAFAHLLLNGVVVDNTTAGKQCEDPGFKTIRKKVHKFANNSLAIPTPVAWVLFRKVLQKVAKDTPIVSYEQAVTVGGACGIAADVVPSVLHFYHELAVFLHYTQIKSLSHCIIADPQWLIKQFGKLLAPKEFRQTVSNQALWKPLQENGILVQPLYEEVWKGSSLQPQQLADLLEYFCLAAFTQQKATSFPGREYFIPAVLPSSSSTTDNVTDFVRKSSPLHLTFSTQYVPPGFFTRLATTLAKKSKCHLLIARGIFRNQVTFAYGEIDKIDEFTIFEHSSSIQIIVVRTEYRESHIPTFGSVCHDVMKLIQACFAVTYEWFPTVKVDTALQCEQCPDFVLLSPGATTNSILLCQAGHTCRFTSNQQYWMKVPNTPEYLAQRGDFTDAELKGVADDVQKAGKLKELADALEVVPPLKSLEVDGTAPFALLKRWRSGIESGLDAHSLLVHHLKCIGLTTTAYSLYYREFVVHSDPSPQTNETNTSAGAFENPGDPLSLNHMVACSRCIDGDLTLLAAVLDIPDEDMATIKSRFKAVQGQAYHMLQKWQSSGTHTKQELAEILQGAGFPQAANILMTSLDTMSTTRQKPQLQDLISDVQTTEWYHLGLQLDVDSFKLRQIQVDARRNQDHLTLMFETWLRVCENPSWQDVVQALKAIGERRLGTRLEQKFCK